jgi:hypothetical protein
VRTRSTSTQVCAAQPPRAAAQQEQQQQEEKGEQQQQPLPVSVIPDDGGLLRGAAAVSLSSSEDDAVHAAGGSSGSSSSGHVGAGDGSDARTPGLVMPAHWQQQIRGAPLGRRRVLQRCALQPMVACLLFYSSYFMCTRQPIVAAQCC